MNQKQWKTKDGTIVNIKDMDDNHLNNTIALIRRNARRIMDSNIASLLCACPNGDGAVMAVEDELYKAEIISVEEYLSEYKVYQNMLKEFNLREKTKGGDKT